MVGTATAAVHGAGSPPGEVVLRTVQLSKCYGGRLAVDQLSLEVRRGGHCADAAARRAGIALMGGDVVSLLRPPTGGPHPLPSPLRFGGCHR
jgi:hypothetical protein